MTRPDERTMMAAMKNALNLPRCSGIDPDNGVYGYFCRTCGGELIERGKWFVHGTRWLYPELWKAGKQ